MSVLWTSVAFVLYAEVALFLFICLPFPVSLKKKFLDFLNHSPYTQTLRGAGQIIFALIALLFADSLRDTMTAQHHHGAVDKNSFTFTHFEQNMKMFRAQRNLYISGGALLLLIVMNRFFAMIREIDALHQAKAQGPKAVASAGPADNREHKE